jgi:hypothetical protein
MGLFGSGPNSGLFGTTPEWQKINEKLEILMPSVLSKTIRYDPELKRLLEQKTVTREYVLKNLKGNLDFLDYDQIDEIQNGKKNLANIGSNILAISKWHSILKAVIQKAIENQVISLNDYINYKNKDPLFENEKDAINVNINNIRKMLNSVQKQVSSVKGGMRTRKLRSKKRGTRRH